MRRILGGVTRFSGRKVTRFSGRKLRDQSLQKEYIEGT